MAGIIVPGGILTGGNRPITGQHVQQDGISVRIQDGVQIMPVDWLGLPIVPQLVSQPGR